MALIDSRGCIAACRIYAVCKGIYPLFSSRPIHSNPERDRLVSRIALATAAKVRVDRGEAVPATYYIDKCQVARNPVPKPWTHVPVKRTNFGRVVVHTYTTCPLMRQEEGSHKKPRLRFPEKREISELFY